MVNKKTIKEFLKPSWKKVLLAIFFVIISLFYASTIPERYYGCDKDRYGGNCFGLAYTPEYACYGFPISFLTRESRAGGDPFEFQFSDLQFGTKRYLNEYPFSDIIHKFTRRIDREIRDYHHIKLGNRFFVTENTERIMFFLYISMVLLIDLLFWYFSVCLAVYFYNKIRIRKNNIVK